MLIEYPFCGPPLMMYNCLLYGIFVFLHVYTYIYIIVGTYYTIYSNTQGKERHQAKVDFLICFVIVCCIVYGV